MSNRHKAIRDAIVEKIKGAVPAAYIIEDPAPTALPNLPPGNVAIDVYCDDIDFQPSEELGAVHQEARWTWRIEVLIPGASSATSLDIWDDIVLAMLYALCPAAGWRPAVECDVVNAVTARFEGIASLGRVYSLVVSHGRYE